MKVKEEEWKSWLKGQHSKKDHGISSQKSMQIDGETMKTVTDFILLVSNITADCDCIHEVKKKKKTCFLEEKLWPT